MLASCPSSELPHIWGQELFSPKVPSDCASQAQSSFIE